MAYTDLTADFDYGDLVVWSKMDQLAENDAYDHFATGTRTFFYQVSAPAAWTKLVTQNDKILRVTSGAGGGTGGTVAASTTNDLAHTHTVSHTHAGVSHSHVLDYTISDPGQRQDMNTDANFPISADSDGSFLRGGDFGGAATVRTQLGNSFNAAAHATSASTAPATDSQLSTFALAYADVIACEKN